MREPCHPFYRGDIYFQETILWGFHPCQDTFGRDVVNARLCGFTNKHSGPVIKTDVIVSKMHSSDDVSLCPGSGVFKTFAGNVIFCAIIGTGKNNLLKQFLQSFPAKKCFMQ